VAIPERAQSNKAFHLNYYFLSLSVSFDQQLVLVANLTEEIPNRSESYVRGGFFVDSCNDVSFVNACRCAWRSRLNSNDFEGPEPRTFRDNRKAAHILFGELIEL
jgi:hypothetical protein